MKSKDLALITAIAVLIFMAVFSQKKILVAEGYAVTRQELEQGEKIYVLFCRNCHANGRSGAPRINTAAWRDQAQREMSRLIGHAVNGYMGNAGIMPPKGGASTLTNEEVALATAYMVAADEKE